MLKPLRLILWVSLLSLFASNSLHAEKFASIIIDDVGNSFEHGRNVIELPVALTIAILPGTTYAKPLARLATDKRKEVMLHLPMQSIEHHDHAPGRLDLHMTDQAFRHQLRQNLNSVPYVRGVNNHMGSLLTRHPGHMAWLMEAILDHGGLFFVDSFTTPDSVAHQVAREYRIPTARRDVFLDNEVSAEAISASFERLKLMARKQGSAVGIGHPYPETLQFLERVLPGLAAEGFELVPVASLLEMPESVKP